MKINGTVTASYTGHIFDGLYVKNNSSRGTNVHVYEVQFTLSNNKVKLELCMRQTHLCPCADPEGDDRTSPPEKSQKYRIS